MKKFLLMAVAVIMTFGSVLTSCDVDNSDLVSEEYGEMIANTRWELSGVLENGTWQQASYFSTFDIPELRFHARSKSEQGDYLMRLNGYGYSDINTITGTYEIKYGTITLSEDPYTGTYFTIRINALEATKLEGELTIWGPEQYTYSPDGNGTTSTRDVMRHTIRMKRVK